MYIICMKFSYLITGGTGSFGQSIVKKLLKFNTTKKIVVFSRDEAKQFDMKNSFKDNKKLRFFIGDVRDLKRCKTAFNSIDIVIHAAALKQVPSSEYNPTEVIKTNISGAENVIDSAISCGVKKVIALSTDKASSPVNLYGATKLVSDKLFCSANNITGKQKIKFSVVRYGNVIGSRGSVIPYFKELLNNKKELLPITHIDMTRFLISLNDGVDFVIKCLDRMHGGEIFIPKIPSAKIIDLAKSIKSNVKFKFTGVRPGEKIHEELCSKNDSLNTIEFKDFYLITPSLIFKNQINYKKTMINEKGKLVKPNFEYNSLNNPWKLSISELKTIIK